MFSSMTAFAVRTGHGDGASWQWELRSVNGKGLDLRLRLPDWIDGLEPLVRTDLARRIQRGNVSLTLKLQRDTTADAMRVNRAALDEALSALSEVTAAAEKRGLTLALPSPPEILALRGVLEQASLETGDTSQLRSTLMSDFARLLDDFTAARQAEGAELLSVVRDQVDLVAGLIRDAATEAAKRRVASMGILKQSLDRVLANAEGVDESRLAQELAFIAVKTDVTEEIDRLTAHVSAAEALLTGSGPVGRKLDFLTQEFNREVNTLCSKAQHIALTRIGLDLKTVIDQMREQIQNVE